MPRSGEIFIPEKPLLNINVPVIGEVPTEERDSATTREQLPHPKSSSK
jgi:hypothetical protein